MNGRGNATSRKRYCIQPKAKKMGHTNVADRATWHVERLAEGLIGQLVGGLIGGPVSRLEGLHGQILVSLGFAGYLLEVSPHDKRGQKGGELPHQQGENRQRQGAQEKIHLR